MIAEIQAGFVGAKAAYDVAKGLHSLATEADRNSAVIDIQRYVVEAQQGLIAAQEAIRVANETIANLRREADLVASWEAEKARYALTESEVQTYTYALRSESANGEPHHHICVTCYNNGRKSVLHGQRILICNVCEKSTRVLRDAPRAVVSSKSNSWMG